MAQIPDPDTILSMIITNHSWYYGVDYTKSYVGPFNIVETDPSQPLTDETLANIRPAILLLTHPASKPRDDDHFEWNTGQVPWEHTRAYEQFFPDAERDPEDWRWRREPRRAFPVQTFRNRALGLCLAYRYLLRSSPFDSELQRKWEKIPPAATSPKGLAALQRIFSVMILLSDIRNGVLTAMNTETLGATVTIDLVIQVHQRVRDFAMLNKAIKSRKTGILDWLADKKGLHWAEQVDTSGKICRLDIKPPRPHGRPLGWTINSILDDNWSWQENWDIRAFRYSHERNKRVHNIMTADQGISGRLDSTIKFLRAIFSATVIVEIDSSELRRVVVWASQARISLSSRFYGLHWRQDSIVPFWSQLEFKGYCARRPKKRSRRHHPSKQFIYDIAGLGEVDDETLGRSRRPCETRPDNSFGLGKHGRGQLLDTGLRIF